MIGMEIPPISTSSWNLNPPCSESSVAIVRLCQGLLKEGRQRYSEASGALGERVTFDPKPEDR